MTTEHSRDFVEVSLKLAHRTLEGARALDLRQKSDYEVFTELEEKEVKDLLSDAEKFVEKVKQVLKQSG